MVTRQGRAKPGREPEFSQDCPSLWQPSQAHSHTQNYMMAGPLAQRAFRSPGRQKTGATVSRWPKSCLCHPGCVHLGKSALSFPG